MQFVFLQKAITWRGQICKQMCKNRECKYVVKFTQKSVSILHRIYTPSWLIEVSKILLENPYMIGIFTNEKIVKQNYN